MGRPRADSHAIPTTERILNAAESAFGENGYRGTRLEDIAAEASIRRPSLLYHFKTKDDLYATVVHRIVNKLRTELEGHMQPTGDFSEIIEQLAFAFRDFAVSHPAFGQIVLRDILDHREPTYHMLINEIAPVLDTVVAFCEMAESDTLPEGLPVRAAIMQFCTDTLLRVSAGPIREPLWGKNDETQALIRRMFVR